LTSRDSDSSLRTGERALIDRIRRRLPSPPTSVIVGPGDDAAVVAPARGALQVLTTDAVVEGVHFDRRFSRLSDVGYKALAVNVSDIVAMGAAPELALLSLILPDQTTVEEVDAMLDGVLEMAAAARMAVVGGNISRSPGPLIVDVTATGSVRPRRILMRGGGHPGDELYLSGSIGAAAAGLGWLRSHRAPELETSGTTDPRARGPADPRTHEAGDMTPCVQRHRRPEPRVRLGMLLGRNKAASACMDLSDGLAEAVRQIAEASGTGAVIDAAALPIEPTASAWFRQQGIDPVIAAVSGGDDYELLFALPRKFRGRFRTVQSGSRGLPLTKIGELTAEEDLLLARDGGREQLPAGFAHF